MPDEVTTPAQGTVETPPSEAPTDYREYAKWRTTGELPAAQEEETPAAPDAEHPPAETPPDSGTDNTQESEDEDENDDDGAAKGKPGSRVRKIERLTREKEELAKANEELKRMIADAVAQDKPSKAAPTEKPPEPGDFQTLAEYQLALANWAIDRRDAERLEAEQVRQQAEAKAAAEAAEKKQMAEWDRKSKAAQKAHADYDELLETVKIPVGPATVAVRQALLEDPNGAEILYHLLSNPKECEAIFAMPPASGVIAIGKLSASFDQPSSAPGNGKPKITGAPKPPPPATHRGKLISDALDDPDVQKDFKRWAKAREAQLKGR